MTGLARLDDERRDEGQIKLEFVSSIVRCQVGFGVAESKQIAACPRIFEVGEGRLVVRDYAENDHSMAFPDGDSSPCMDSSGRLGSTTSVNLFNVPITSHVFSSM